MDLFDVGGPRVKQLVQGTLPLGRNAIVWDGLDESGSRVPAGVYFVRLQQGISTSAQKLVRIDD